MDRLVKALIKRQKAEKLGNNAFARRLGVDKATWSNVRRGLQAPSGGIYSAAMRVYPDVVVGVARELEISNDRDVPSPHPDEAVAS